MIDYKVVATSQRHRPATEFWRRRLASLDVNADEGLGTGHRESVQVEFDAASIRTLDKLASDPLGRFTVVTAALALTVARFFNRRAVVFRTPLLDDGSEAALNAEAEVPLMLTVDAQATLRQLLEHVVDIAEQSYSFQDFPVAALMRNEQEPRTEALAGFSLSCSLVHRGRVAAPASVHFNCDAIESNRIVIDWAPDAVEPVIASGLAVAVAGAIAHFDQGAARVGEVERAPASQREQLLVEWNSTADPSFAATCVHTLFERQVAETPEATAIRFGAEALTYRQLNRRANRIAAHLIREAGVRPVPIVGLRMSRSPLMVATVLGILKAGRAYLPIDPDCPPVRLTDILNDSGVVRIVGDADAAALVQEGGDEDDRNPDATVSPSDLAYLIYTSGSTGRPKGCAIEHRSLSHYVQWAAGFYWPARASGTMGLFSPLSFDLTVTSLFCPLLRGRTLVVCPPQANVEDVLRDQFSPTSPIDTIKLTPSHISLLETLKIGATNIRTVIVGGEALTARHVEILERIDPRIRVFNEYGPTEATVGCVVKEIAAGDRITIGRPIARTRVYVLDDSQMLVPVGVAGEICVSGEGVARGYHARAALTAARFLPNPFVQGERLYRTGDVGRWLPSGEIECFGRLDDQVKIRGHRVELGEVEAALRDCAGVRDAVVVIDRHDADAATDLVAYVVTGGVDDTPALHRALSSRLPDYMVPSAFVAIDALPLTPNGKVDRARLPPRSAGRRASPHYASPRGREEQALVRIWQDVFRVDRIGVDDDFFELGGHSLRAMQMIMRIQRELGVEVSLNDIFRSTTISQLADVIREAAPSTLEPIRPLPAASHYAVSHGQQRLWILNQLEENAAAYNVSSAFELAGTVDRSSLERALQRLIARHESLRTTFLIADNEPRQRILDEMPFDLRAVDVSASADPDERARQLVAADALGAFDLAAGPLIRATLITLAPSRFVLGVTMHHIVTDEWSFGVLIEDLIELYRRERTGSPEPLPSLPIQYKDFAAWQRALLASGAAERHRRYWLEKLAGDLPPLDLPADRPRPAVPSNAGSRLRFSLDAATTSALKQTGTARGASLFITLVAVVKVLLHRYTGQEEIRVGVPIAGRTQIELSDQVGFYLNTLVLRDRIESNSTFSEVLDAVTATATGAYEHDLFPFDRLVEELETSRAAGRVRLFDVLVVQGNDTPIDLRFPELAVYGFDTPVDVSKFDLSFLFEEDHGGLSVEIQYDTELFLPERIRRLREHFETLVTGILAQPHAAIGALPVLTVQEQAAVESFAAARQQAALDANQQPLAAFVAPATEREIALTAIWRQVLGGGFGGASAAIGVHDNFFELGGDSILALQIVSRANTAGLHVTLKQLFRHPTIAGLAALATASADVRSPDGGASPTGPAPLTPIEHWFIDLDWPEPSQFTQSLLLEVPAGVDHRRLDRAVGRIAAHHDALRLRVVRTGAGWQQSIDAPGAPGTDPIVSVEPLPDVDGLARRSEAIQRSLDISGGPIFRVVLFDDSPARTGRLLIVIHHLAVDGVSWRVLLDDLRSAYEADEAQLPARTLSFREWAGRLQTWAGSPPVTADIEYWTRTSSETPASMAPDLSADAAGNTARTEAHVSVRLDETATTALLTRVPRAYNTQINDALLSGLALGIAAHTGSRSVLVDLESHGREDLDGRTDVSRTVGWFTSMCPVRITVPVSAQPGDTLKTVKDTLRLIPSGGMSYGLLRYLSPDAAIRARMRDCPAAPIRFNYLGQTDQSLQHGDWRVAAEPIGAAQSPLGRRSHLIDVVAVVSDGCLEIDWIYSRALHRRETIAALADASLAALRDLVHHCTTPGANGFAPSDAYDLTPVQQGMLFHSLLDPASGVYVEQWRFTIRGPLDETALRQAWAATCRRHAVLRTAFFWEGLEQPVQVAFDDVVMPWTDVADVSAGFEMSRAPLMRAALERVSDQEHRFCWTWHHILMDGWSAAIVLRDVIGEYERLAGGGRAAPPAAPPFRHYVEWLRDQDRSLSGAYWKDRLDGVTRPTPLPPGTASGAADSAAAVSHLQLGAGLTRELAMFTRRHHLTMNTLVSGAWAMTLAAASGVRDVVCGVTLAGRPAALDGAETTVGLFINTLPMRFRVDGQAPLLSWLHDLQRDQADLDQHAYSALVDVQRWSGIPRGLPLFDSIIVFENYPVEQTMEAGASGLTLENVTVLERTNYPLTFIAVPGDDLLLKLNYDPARYDDATTAGILRRVQALLEAFIQEPHQALASWLTVAADDATAEEPAPILASCRKPLDAGLTGRLDVLNAVAAALHFRYSAHEEIRCAVGGVTLTAGDVRDTDTLATLLERRVPDSAGSSAHDTRHDLVLTFDADGSALTIGCSTDRFDSNTLDRAHAHFATLAASLINAPDAPIAYATLLPDDERRLLIEDFNRTATGWGPHAHKTIVELFEERAALHPDRIAVVVPAIGRDDMTVDRTWTYAELNAAANRLAGHLSRRYAVGPDVLVGVMAERSFEMVLALVAILKAGGAYVPLDPEYPADRLSFMIEDSGVSVLLTHESLRPAAAAFGGTAIYLDTGWPGIAVEPDGNPPHVGDGASLAYMIYTSGSTGRPKGALNTHDGIANRLLWMQDAYGLGEDDHVLQKTPFSFDVSVWEFFWPLMTGARLVVAAPGGHRDSRYLVDVIEQARVTTLHFVPSMLQAFVDEPGLDRCRHLRRVICSGEALSPELLRRFTTRLSGVPLHNLYGPTEAAVDVTSWECDAAAVTTVVPIGKPIANTQMYLLDERLQPVPLGFNGELFIGGVNVGRGYRNRADLTAEKFLADPFSTRAGARLYRTGDLCRYRADGNIEFLGRLDHQVKVRGFRIELGEIESTLAGHPGVRECVVIVREDTADQKRIVAYVVPASAEAKGSLRTSAVRAFLHKTLPDYMLPSVVVPLAELPKLPNGKRDRRSLPAPAAARERRPAEPRAPTSVEERANRPAVPAPAPLAPEPIRSAGHTYVPPRDDIERRLALAWAHVLGVEPVGVTDNYFELGGHSILALKLISRIQVELGRTIPLAHLFAYPTVERLAAAIRFADEANDWRPLVAITPSRSGRPIFLLPGAGGNVIYFYQLAHALTCGRPVYGLQAVGLDGVTAPLTNVADIAAHNIDEIKRVQPAGPYFLVGHSFGGKVALEMSQQLVARGDDVGLLAILDTPAPVFDPIVVGRDWQDAHWLAKISREIEEYFGVRLDVRLDDLLTLPLDGQLDLVVERMREAGMWAPGADRTPLLGYLRVYKANTQSDYIRADTAGTVPIALFKTQQEDADFMRQPAWGWERFATGAVRVADVPGDHLSMLADPHVIHIARALDELLS